MSQKVIRRYNSKDCVTMIDGVFITGFGEDKIELAKDEDMIDPQVGADGDVVVNEINNDLWTVTLTIQPTSPQRQYLFELANSHAQFPISMINKSLGESFSSTRAAFQTMPTISRGRTAGEESIVIRAFDGRIELQEGDNEY